MVVRLPIAAEREKRLMSRDGQLSGVGWWATGVERGNSQSAAKRSGIGGDCSRSRFGHSSWWRLHVNRFV